MSKLGVSSVALNWFESYLGNRKQCVFVGHELSDELPVSYGVPQGSIMVPLFFNVYIDKLPTTMCIKKRLVFEIQICHNYSDLIVLKCVELMICDKSVSYLQKRSISHVP